MGLHISRNVMSADIEGFLVILDLKTEAYHILNPVGTSMWNSLLAAEDEADALRALEEQYAVDGARLRTDLENFRRGCLEQGFLQETEPETASEIGPATPVRGGAGERRFLALRAWWSLWRTVRTLSAKGFARTYREYALSPVPDEPEHADELLERAVAAFRTAENFFLIKRAPTDCMPRSLALFRFLRSTGLAVEHRIGVRRFPFDAHAWVEHRGRVVLDDPSRQAIYATLARISP